MLGRCKAAQLVEGKDEKEEEVKKGCERARGRDALVLYPRLEQARDAPLLQQRADDADLGTNLRADEGAASVVRV